MSPFIVAELSANHNGSIERALRIVECVARAGADAIKVQTWTRGAMCVSDYTLDHGPWSGWKLRDLYEEAFLPWEWHEPIFKAARALGLEAFSAPFDVESADFLETLGVERYKIASFELTDVPLIRHVARKAKPMVMSTGMATDEEITDAWDATGQAPVTLCICTSAYPADASHANLARHREIGGAWGLSDHSPGLGVAVAATALGASYIEKHLTLSRADGGLDAGFSMEPQEFAEMVTACRQAAAAMGNAGFGPTTGENITLRRSLWVVKDIPAGGQIVFGDNVRTARPAFGLPCDTPVDGKIAAHALAAGKPLLAEDLA